METHGSPQHITERVGLNQDAIQSFETHLGLNKPHTELIKDNADLIVSMATALNSRTASVNLDSIPKLPKTAQLLLLTSKLFGNQVYQKSASFVEHKAGERILKQADKIDQFLDAMENIPNPREQFVTEVAQLYERLNKDGRALNNSLEYFIWDLGKVKDGDRSKKTAHVKEEYPLMVSIWTLLDQPTNTRDALRFRVGTRTGLDIISPEIKGVLSKFVEMHGHTPTPIHTKYNTKRYLGQLTGSQKLKDAQRSVPQKLSAILNDIYTILPTEGSSFSDSIREECRKLADLKKTGQPSIRILQQAGWITE